MFYQKTTQNAIAAVSRLAELFRDSEARTSSRDIAESRNLPVPIVAKILTELSRGGLIVGAPGPGGGYRLARPPAEISLKDVADLFERDVQTACPYGAGWCGPGEPCPGHPAGARGNEKHAGAQSRLSRSGAVGRAGTSRIHSRPQTSAGIAVTAETGELNQRSGHFPFSIRRGANCFGSSTTCRTRFRYQV